MTKNNTCAVLRKCPLFHGVSDEALYEILNGERTVLREFPAGEEIPLDLSEGKALVILLGGTALAYSKDPERTVILRTIPPGTAFGVSVLFSDEEPVSTVRAKNAVKALYLPASAVLTLIEENAPFRMNYIGFLSGRIRFLNRRIACYTAGSAERRLALYLSELPETEPRVSVLDLSLTDLSELLDIGRASLYRAFGRLSELGLISRSDRRITVLDRSALLRYGESDSDKSSL